MLQASKFNAVAVRMSLFTPYPVFDLGSFSGRNCAQIGAFIRDIGQGQVDAFFCFFREMVDVSVLGCVAELGWEGGTRRTV